MNNSEMLETLQIVPLFHSLSPEELEQVANIVIERSYPKKTTIFLEGSPKEAIFFIRDGLVKTVKTDKNGHEQIVSLLKNGDMFPHTGLFNKSPYPARAESILTTSLLAIPIRQFEQLLLQFPLISIKLLEILGEKIHELQQKIQEMGSQDVNQRATSFLLKLAKQHGKLRNGHIQIDVPLTHQEFANSVGTTRETVNRLLNRLRKEGFIQTERNRLTILDIDALQKFQES